MSRLRAARALASLGAAVLRGNLGSRKPFKATVVLTDRCDCRCEICWIWKKPKGAEPSPADVARLLREAGTIRWLNLTGGEIFLRDDVAEVVEAALAAEPRLAVVDFPTTGQRTDRIVAAAERIGRLGIPRVFATVSLEGPPELHDRLRGRDGAFERATATLRALRAVPGVRAYVGFTASDRNSHALAATVEAVSRRVPGFSEREVHVNVATRSGHYYDNLSAGVGRPPDPRRALRRVLRARRSRATPTDWLEAAYLARVPEHARTGRSPVPCRSLSASVFVSASGEVRPCTVYDRPLGNAYERPLPELLATEEASAARRAIREDRCPGCWSPCEAYQTILTSLPRALLG